MKVLLADLKKAISFFEAHTAEISVAVALDDGRVLLLRGFDKLGQSVEIQIYLEGTLLPKIVRTDVL